MSPFPGSITEANATGSVSFSADHADAAQRRYKKDLDLIKPDLEAYNEQKEKALGLGPGALTRKGSGSPDADGQVCVCV
jgi:hypothetical protein